MDKEMMKKERISALLEGYLSRRTAEEIRNKTPLEYRYPPNHLPEPTADAISLETCFLTARER
jgi:hypothetical protein